MFYYIISFLLHFAALKTYWRWVNKTEDVEALNWFLHGFGIGLAFIPFAWFGVSTVLILIRSLVLGLSMMFWSEWNDNAVWEETGRGALIVLTVLLLKL